MPNYIKPSGRYDWKRMIDELQKHPDQWMLMLHDAPVKLLKEIGGPTAVFNQNLRSWKRPNGRLQAYGRNVYTSTEGHGRADIYLRWHPIEGYNVLKKQ